MVTSLQRLYIMGLHCLLEAFLISAARSAGFKYHTSFLVPSRKSIPECLIQRTLTPHGLKYTPNIVSQTWIFFAISCCSTCSTHRVLRRSAPQIEGSKGRTSVFLSSPAQMVPCCSGFGEAEPAPRPRLTISAPIQYASVSNPSLTGSKPSKRPSHY